MPQSFSSVTVHIVFGTKHRLPLISQEIERRLYPYIGGILRARKTPLLSIGGDKDHIHMLISLARDVSLAELIREVKSLSSGWIHNSFAFKRDFEWQSGYGAFSVTFANIGGVKAYLAGQKKHHCRMSFKQEYFEFLKRHNLVYDERYIWD